MRNKSKRDREMDNRAYNGECQSSYQDDMDAKYAAIYAETSVNKANMRNRRTMIIILSITISVLMVISVGFGFFFMAEDAKTGNSNPEVVETSRPGKDDTSEEEDEDNIIREDQKPNQPEQAEQEQPLTVTGGYTYKNHDFEAGKCIDNLYDKNGKMQFTVKSLEDTWHQFKTLGNVYAMINVNGGMKMAVLRNNKGESLVASETGSIAVYPHGRGLDNTLVYFSDDDSFVTEDITQIDLLAKGVYELKNSGLGHLNGIDWGAEEAGASKEEAGARQSEDKVISYMFTIDYCGYDEIHKLYSSVSKEYADKMVNGMKESLKDAKETVNLRLMYICGDTGMAGGACGVYISNEPLTASDKDTQKLQLLWDFNEIRLVYDWELPEKLYKHNFKDETPKNVEKLSSIVYDTTMDLTKMLQTWEKDRETDAMKEGNGGTITEGKGN